MKFHQNPSVTVEKAFKANANIDGQKSEKLSFKKKHQTIGLPPQLSIEKAMRISMKQFIVKRDEFQTVIAGYPWFLDWGRDTLICLRGIIAAGRLKEAENILLQFAKFEKGGTIPNMIRGNDDSNRETSDAPLWFFVACNELMDAQGNRKLLKAGCFGLHNNAEISYFTNAAKSLWINTLKM